MTVWVNGSAATVTCNDTQAVAADIRAYRVRNFVNGLVIRLLITIYLVGEAFSHTAVSFGVLVFRPSFGVDYRRNSIWTVGALIIVAIRRVFCLGWLTISFSNSNHHSLIGDIPSTLTSATGFLSGHNCHANRP